MGIISGLSPKIGQLFNLNFHFLFSKGDNPLIFIINSLYQIHFNYLV